MEKFLRDETGVTAIEYGLIAAAMGAMLIVATPSLSNALKTKFTLIAGYLK